MGAGNKNAPFAAAAPEFFLKIPKIIEWTLLFLRSAMFRRNVIRLPTFKQFSDIFLRRFRLAIFPRGCDYSPRHEKQL
jgi:hypothetical protein